MNRLTLPEYRLMMKAQELKEFDENYKAHRLAFLCMVATGKKKDKPVYRKFKDFFDYERELNKLKQRTKQDQRMNRMREYVRGRK